MTGGGTRAGSSFFGAAWLFDVAISVSIGVVGDVRSSLAEESSSVMMVAHIGSEDISATREPLLCKKR